MDDNTTHKPVAVLYPMKVLSKAYTASFAHHNNKMGFNLTQRMTVIETAAVLSDMGVGDQKVLGILQKHIRMKYHGNNCFVLFVT